MGYFYKILETDMELLAAALSEVPVAVWLKSGASSSLRRARSEPIRRNPCGFAGYPTAGSCISSVSLPRVRPKCIHAQREYRLRKRSGEIPTLRLKRREK